MAHTKNIDRSKISPEMMKKAREAAEAKLARMLAEQELGIGDSSMPVQKGPIPIENEPLIAVTVDLAPFADRIALDGQTPLMHGQTYNLPMRQAQVVLEQMMRTWMHQAEIEGKDHEFYLKNRMAHTALRLSPVKGTARVAA